jgi:glyoxylase I family protein
MEILGIDHVGIVTGNIQETAAFYTEHLGFTAGPVEEARDLKLKTLNLLSGRDKLELLEPESKEGTTFGLRHIAFKCRNIEQVLEEISARNLTLLHKSPLQYKNLKFFFCKAPDGVLLEFIEETQ